jgi:hypothetical protein
MSSLKNQSQHGLNLRRLFELSARLRPYLIHRNAIRKLNQRQSLGEIDIKHALIHS